MSNPGNTPLASELPLEEYEVVLCMVSVEPLNWDALLYPQ
jgi:hypothetical protein